MTKTQSKNGARRAAGPTSIRLPADLSEFLRQKAGQKKISVASIILHLVQNWKDDEEQRLWDTQTGQFCGDCQPRLVDLLYRKEGAEGSYQRRYNTPPLTGVDS